jgi:hypothetical protein
VQQNSSMEQKRRAAATREEELQRQLTPAGFSERDYDNVRRQLEQSGKARLVVPLPENLLRALG